MLSIGNFSKISNVTTKTLRYYDEIGLIKPSHINEENGYRYYDVSQLETILLINKLKGYSFSLEEISSVIKNRYDDALLCRLLHKKREEAQKKLTDLGLSLNSLENDIKKMEGGTDIMAYLQDIEVKLIETTPMNVISVRETVSTEDYGRLIGKLYERINKEKLTPAGAPLTIYYDMEFNPTHADMEVAIPVKEVVTGTKEFGGGLCATTRHKGLYSDLPSAYARINEWVDKEGYSIPTPPYEVYVTNPGDTKPDENITDIYFPVKK